MTKIKKLTFESASPLTSKQMKLIVGGSGVGAGLSACDKPKCQSNRDCPVGVCTKLEWCPDMICS